MIAMHFHKSQTQVNCKDIYSLKSIFISSREVSWFNHSKYMILYYLNA